jgi:diguanylate cyclase (GGDEF)-like protein
LIEALDQVSLRGDIDVKSVVFIDLDGFKDVNDIYGHSVGDDLIIAIAKHCVNGSRLAGCWRVWGR